ncbi:MAG: 6-phosphogluconolactonase [Elusimicrobiota bacterium]
MTQGSEVEIAQSARELFLRAAARFASAAEKAIQDSGRFSAALSGGRTPEKFYELLSRPPFAQSIPWDRCHFFWGDERCVPPENEQSNYRMVQEALLSRIKIPPENIHRFQTEFPPQEAARRYEDDLRGHFNLGPKDIPRLDQIWLGLGTDGHTASLFPGGTALAATHQIAAADHVAALGSWRLTLTLPVLNAAAEAVFLVSGTEKAKITRRILDGSAPDLPAARVRPEPGAPIWMLDKDAAGLLG